MPKSGRTIASSTAATPFWFFLLLFKLCSLASLTSHHCGAREGDVNSVKEACSRDDGERLRNSDPLVLGGHEPCRHGHTGTVTGAGFGCTRRARRADRCPGNVGCIKEDLDFRLNLGLVRQIVCPG